jgi:hypothetical protein
MRELRPAIHPLLDAEPLAGAGGSTAFPLSRAAVVASVVVHLAGVYVVGRVAFRVDEPALVLPRAEYVWLDTRMLPPSAPPVDEPQVVETPAVPPETESREPAAERLPPPRPVVEEAPPIVAPTPVPLEPAVEAELSDAVEPRIDFEAERRRAAAEVVEERAREGNYLTFSIRDVAPPRPDEEPEQPSIFDGARGGSRGPTVGQLGQARTRFGHRVSALCNALTGGFSLMGWGSFCAPPDDEPSGLFPELMPAYLQLQPKCVETRPLADEIGDGSPFPTIKCELVPRVEEERWAFPGPRPDRVGSVDGTP